VPLLLQLNPSSGNYFEPFLGAGHLFFSLSPARATLSDLNESLIEAYQAIADDPAAVISIASSLDPTRAGYYAARSAYHRLRSPVRRGAYFLFLNRLCWNGLYRQNKDGRFNVPYGSPKTPRKGALMDWDLVTEASRLLRRSKVLHADFQTVTARAKAGDFIYLDPPYVLGREGRVFSEYVSTSFTLEDEKRLAAEAQRLTRLGAYVVVSHAFSSAVLDEYGDDFLSVKIARAQTIAGKSSSRKSLDEIILVSKTLPATLSRNTDAKTAGAKVALARGIVSKGLQHRGQSLEFVAVD
jgi:DNA adenine methylase